MFFNLMNKYMSIALEEARLAFAMGEVPVGSVIVFENTIIAKAHNLVESLQNPLMHAEIIAIHKACNFIGSKYLDKCDLYTTLEPCAMCASAISLSRVQRLFYGADDSKYGALESGLNFFKIASSNYVRPIEIYDSICSLESKRLMTDFFQKLR